MKRGFLQTLQHARRVQQLADTDLQTTVHKRLPLSNVGIALDLYQQNMTAGKILLVANPQEVPPG
jgi:hypothetical protein